MKLAAFVPATILLASCTSTSGSREPQIDGFDRAAAVVQSAIDRGKLPGAVLWIESEERAAFQAFGERSVRPTRAETRLDTIYDLASLTKVMATAPSVVILIERGQIELDAPVSRYLPEFKGGWRGAVTVRHLLTHTSSLPAGIPLDAWTGYEEGLKRALAAEPINEPGRVFLYSDVNFILLGEIVRLVSGRTLDQFAAENIYGPLGMTDTGFKPGPSSRIAPTELVDEEMLHGVVHDPTSRRMGGVTGHAGLFSSARDVARYARMILGRGMIDGIRVMSSQSVSLMTSAATPDDVFARRAPGWDVDTGYSRPRGGFPLGSFGHTGWTGTFIWIDPSTSSFYFLLSNRVHPQGKGSVVDLQRDLGFVVSDILLARDSVAEGVRVNPAGAGDTLPGIDVLVNRRYALLKGKKIGLITNHTGRDRRGNPTIDLLRSAADVELVRLFSPEHGIAGALDAKIDDSVDQVRGIPIVSLYGERRAPDAAHLDGLDALVFDIQDIGARYYTYISTMGLAMRAAGESGVEFIVLDRPNPIGGAVEGPVAEGESSFTSYHPIAMRHGMTVGELARMFADELDIDVELTVVPVEGWTRDELWEDTGIPWVNPSPNIRDPEAALLYPMLGFLETTNISVGRGTDAPFHQLGSPWIDGPALAASLASAIPSDCLRFAPVTFTPSSSVHQGVRVEGVHIEVVDSTRCSMVQSGLVLADTLSRYEEWDTQRLNILLRHESTAEAIRHGRGAEAAPSLWQPALARFLERRERFLAYERESSRLAGLDGSVESHRPALHRGGTGRESARIFRRQRCGRDQNTPVRGETVGLQSKDAFTTAGKHCRLDADLFDLSVCRIPHGENWRIAIGVVRPGIELEQKLAAVRRPRYRDDRIAIPSLGSGVLLEDEPWFATRVGQPQTRYVPARTRRLIPRLRGDRTNFGPRGTSATGRRESLAGRQA